MKLVNDENKYWNGRQWDINIANAAEYHHPKSVRLLANNLAALCMCSVYVVDEKVEYASLSVCVTNAIKETSNV